MASAGMHSFLKKYRGGSDDFDEFWRKFLVTANIQKWSTEAARMENFPLFLERDAFLVWDELSDDDKKSQAKVKARLEAAFTLSKGRAYQLFVTRTLGVGESVDAYAADLRRLLVASGQAVTADGKSPVLIEQFIRGLPMDYARQARTNGDSSTITKCVDYVRSLISAELPRSDGGSSAAAVAPPPGGPSGHNHGNGRGQGRGRSVVCFNCNGVGHMARNCTRRAQGQRTGRRPAQTLTCHFCDEVGHIKQDCRAWDEWKRSRNRDTLAAAPQKSGPDAVLAMAAACNPRLPRIHTDMCVGDVKTRTISVVDTGSTRNLVSSRLARTLGCDVKASTLEISTIDGTALSVLGVADVTMSRLDSNAVYLPETVTGVVVVDSLDSVNAEAVIGLELISALGGVDVRYDGDQPVSVVFGTRPDVCASAANTSEPKHPLRHVEVEEDGRGNVKLSTDDGFVIWNAEEKHWTLTWTWKGEEPEQPVGPGIGEYPRSKLTDEQEQLFQREVDGWLESGWLIPHDPVQHGSPRCVLPLIAQVQDHKPSTPVRPCLDYRLLNKQILSNPGLDAPACGEKIRKWRQAGPADEYVLLDIKKAYLQVHVSADLQPYQAVLWRGKLYMMARMGFGLAVAPKFMDIIVKYVLRDYADTDNYVDDLFVPKRDQKEVEARLEEYGLTTKPAESVPTARVLGLQLSAAEDGVQWSRRDVNLQVPKPATKRSVFSWCGKLLGHYPVCGYLRPACSFIKRQASVSSESWDSPVNADVVQLCNDLLTRIGESDPARGVWSASVRGAGDDVTVWCDASDLAYGVVLEANGAVIEDRSWLRPKDDKRHINIAELDAAIKALELSAEWNVSRLVLRTDSKTVFGWVQSVLKNTARVKTSGLQNLLVQRRLQIIADMVDVAKLSVTVEWVPSEKNPADKLTRVPQRWLDIAKASSTANDARDDVASESVLAAACDSVSAATASESLPSLSCAFISLEQVISAQQDDTVIQSIVTELSSGKPVSADLYKKVQNQLVLVDGLVYRSIRDPIDGEVSVPLLPESLWRAAVSYVHANTAHGSWETMWRSLRRRCYFPNMAEMCREFVKLCGRCKVANPTPDRTEIPKVRNDVPSRPWEVVHIDTLELGPTKSGPYRCVLVCVDAFSKWVEVVPLMRHDGASVSAALIELCTRWGPPRVVRCDNGTEFRNVIVSAVLSVFGVHVSHGAVRHPQSQGAAERFNRSLITMIRKSIDDADDWLTELQVLLYYYRTRPHAVTKISPMMAMLSWEPQDLTVESPPKAEGSLMSWQADLAATCARVRDHVTECLAELDGVVKSPLVCPLSVGDPVLLRRPGRHRKLLTPFESGWKVVSIISPTSVRIQKTNVPGRPSVKTVNLELLKQDVASDVQCEHDVDDDAGMRHEYVQFPVLPPPDDPIPANEHADVPRYDLRPRSQIAPPARLLPD